MPTSSLTLYDLQALFAKSILDKQLSPELKVMLNDSPHQGDRVEKRFQIYLGTVYQRLQAILRQAYPFTFKILGDKQTEQTSALFIQQNFPTVGCLQSWGDGFAGFLKKHFDKTPLLYLMDVAQLEWEIHQAYFSPDSPTLQPDRLELSPESILSACFAPHPGLRLFASAYPLQQIWQLCNSPTPQDFPKVSLDAGSSWACITRPQDTVEIHWLDAQTYTFFEFLTEGNTFEKSAEKITAICPQFDFQKALEFAFEKGLFKKIYTFS